MKYDQQKKIHMKFQKHIKQYKKHEKYQKIKRKYVYLNLYIYNTRMCKK